MLKLNNILLCCAIFVSAGLWAQTTKSGQPKSQEQSGTVAAGQGQQASRSAEGVPQAQAVNQQVRTTVRGCVQAGEDRTTLTDSSGNTFLLRGDVATLKKAQHKVVEISGEQSPPASQENTAAIPSIDVRTVREVADSCPVHIYQRPQAKPATSKRNEANTATAPYSGPREGPQGQQSGPPDAVINTQGTGGAPSPGTGNQSEQPPTEQPR